MVRHAQQGFLGLLPARDVLDRDDQAQLAADGFAHRGRADRDPDRIAPLRDEARLALEIADLAVDELPEQRPVFKQVALVGDLVEKTLEQLDLGKADDLGQLAVDPHEAAFARQQGDADRGLGEGQAEEFLALLQAQAGLALEGDVMADQQQDVLVGLAGAADVELEVAHPVGMAVDRDDHAVLRRAGRQRGGHAFGQFRRRQQRFQPAGRLERIVRDAEHVPHRRIHRADPARRIRDDQPGGHAADDLFQVVLVLHHAAPVGMRIGVEGQAHVQANDLEHAVEHRPEAFRLGVELLPQEVEHARHVLAVGPDIPFRLQPDALVDQPDPQAVADVGAVVVARGQAAEIGGLRVLQALDGAVVLHQLAQLGKAEDVLVEVVREGVGILHHSVQLAQQAQVVRAQVEESHAFGDFLLVESNFASDRVDRFIQCVRH